MSVWSHCIHKVNKCISFFIYNNKHKVNILISSFSLLAMKEHNGRTTVYKHTHTHTHTHICFIHIVHSEITEIFHSYVFKT